jgi:hypothetical protein
MHSTCYKRLVPVAPTTCIQYRRVFSSTSTRKRVARLEAPRPPFHAMISNKNDPIKSRRWKCVDINGYLRLREIKEQSSMLELVQFCGTS